MDTQVVRYVAGLLFSDDRSRVVLIMKKRPAWQCDCLNGIGGHVEPGETEADAMTRKFLEETGAVVDWTRFCTLRGQGWTVEWFKSFGEVEISDQTDEHVDWFSVYDVMQNVPVVENVRWLIMMALDNVQGVVDE